MEQGGEPETNSETTPLNTGSLYSGSEAIDILAILGDGVKTDDPDGQRWKLDDNKKLENKEGVWKSDDSWIFKPKDDDLIYIENISNTKVLGATSDGKVILEDFEEGKAHQLWKKGELDAEDYFTLENSGVPKVLTAISESRLEIKDLLYREISTHCTKDYSNLTITELVDERSEKQDVLIAFYINVTIKANRFWILYGFTVFGMILVTLAESSEAYRDGKRYFTSKANWLDFGNLICAGICLLLTVTRYKDTAVWFGSTSVLLSWIIIALSVGDMPIVGNWVYLLGNTVKKVTTFLLVFMPLLFGFGLRFRFMFPDKVSGFFVALYKAILMLVNTYKYDADKFGTNINKDSFYYEYWVEVGTYGTFILALIVLTISFQNILIGLAVNLAKEAYIDAKYNRRWSMAQNLRSIRKFLNCCRKEVYEKYVPNEAFLRCNKSRSWSHIWKQSEGRKFVLFFWNAVVLGEYLVYDTKSNAIKKGKIIGTVPKECVEDAISLVKERNEKRVQKKKREEDNQKIQDENRKAKEERERILDLLKNVMTALQNK